MNRYSVNTIYAVVRSIICSAIYSATGILLIFCITACEQPNDRIKEIAGVEGQAQAQAQVRAENENLTRLAQEMEKDLSLRHRFYQAIKGIYEGTIASEETTYRIRVTLVPTVVPYLFERIRRLDEIVYDLNNLNMNAQVVLWNQAELRSAVGCQSQAIRADLKTGEFAVASEGCPNFYMFYLASPNHEDLQKSINIASAIRSGQTTEVLELHGRLQPTTHASMYFFVANRTQPSGTH